MDPHPFRIMSLFAGIGGLDLALRIAVPHARTLVYVEREVPACAILASLMEAGILDAAPIWTDVTTFNVEGWCGVVDCIIAGAPCQPYSVAGKQQGDADERYLWPSIFRIIEGVQPAMVFLENVPNLLRWFRPVGEELCRLGYEFEAGIFSAAEVGAPHRRERLFVLAHRPSERQRFNAEPHSQSDGSTMAHRTGSRFAWGKGEQQYIQRPPLQASRPEHGDGADVAFANGEGPPSEHYRQPDAQRSNDSAGPPDRTVADAGSERRQQIRGSASGHETPDARRSETGNYESECESEGMANASDRQFPESGQRPEGRNGTGSTGEILDHSTRDHRRGGIGRAKTGTWQDEIGRGRLAGSDGTAVGHADLAGPQGRSVSGCERADELFAWPPGPTDADQWRSILERWPELAPAADTPLRRQLINGSPPGESGHADERGKTDGKEETKPELRSLVDGLSLELARTDKLRGLGNAVVPLTAAMAFITLARKAGLL